MNCFVAVTDNEWFRYLSGRAHLDEVNFWQPSGSSQFRALAPGEPFLFKLHAPLNWIVGGGFFALFSLLPYRTAWDFFGEKNGADSLPVMRARIAKYRRVEPSAFEDYTIGCIILTEPFFLEESDWISVPPDWSPNIVRGKGYDLAVSPGKELWEELELRLQGRNIKEGPVGDAAAADGPAAAMPQQAGLQFGSAVASSGSEGVGRSRSLYGEPTLVRPRLGQGAFRALVTDTYKRRCAVTGEKALPVLEAAHILPVSEGGDHRLDNGLLLRSDIHRLFDRGYVTVAPDHRFRVSSMLRDEFENGEPYYPLEGTEIWLPGEVEAQPNRQFLEWHADSVFRG